MHIGSFRISAVVMFTVSYSCIRVNFFIFETVSQLLSTIWTTYRIVFIFEAALLSVGATQPLPRDGEAAEPRRDSTVKPHTEVLTAKPKIDLHRSSEARQARKR